MTYFIKCNKKSESSHKEFIQTAGSIWFRRKNVKFHFIFICPLIINYFLFHEIVQLIPPFDRLARLEPVIMGYISGGALKGALSNALGPRETLYRFKKVNS